MPLLSAENGELINASLVSNELLINAIELINGVYVLFGGIVGISVLFFFMRLYENKKFKKHFKTLEEDIAIIKKLF